MLKLPLPQLLLIATQISRLITADNGQAALALDIDRSRERARGILSESQRSEGVEERYVRIKRERLARSSMALPVRGVGRGREEEEIGLIKDLKRHKEADRDERQAQEHAEEEGGVEEMGAEVAGVED